LPKEQKMTMKFDLLVYLGFVGVMTILIVSAVVLAKTPESQELETRKIRFAAATFTGILVLLIFVSTLYYADQVIGKDIFDKILGSMTPLAGAIIGYLFASKK
jgi:cytochrome bd-type quinol oxidase subunit 2